MHTTGEEEAAFGRKQVAITEVKEFLIGRRCPTAFAEIRRRSSDSLKQGRMPRVAIVQKPGLMENRLHRRWSSMLLLAELKVKPMMMFLERR